MINVVSGKNLLKRFVIYQKERFPFAILIFTTLSVVLSSAAIVLGNNFSFSAYWKQILIGTLTCLFFMFSIRVFDDHKDKFFDGSFHKNRPIQRGLIKLSELNKINLISLVIQGGINLIFSFYSFIFWCVALVYSLIAKKEFFIKKYIRKKFVLYNILNLMQIFFLQIYLYALLKPDFSIEDPLLAAHFIFVLSNAGIIEVARKLKSKNEESGGKDTYSERYGALKASLIYFSICAFSLILFLVMFFSLSNSFLILFLSIAAILLAGISIIYYFLKRNKTSSKIVEGIALVFYLTMHLLLVGAVI